VRKRAVGQDGVRNLHRKQKAEQTRSAWCGAA
jgi:hypothetical protein